MTIRATTGATTMADLLFGSEAPPATQIEDTFRSDPGITHITQRAAAATAASTYQVASAIAAYLQLPAVDVIMSAWRKTRRLQAACAETRGRPDARQLVALGEHVVTAERTVHVVAEIAGGRVPMVDIGLSCSFRLEALVMEVVGGDVVGCTPASAQTTVELTAIDPSRPGEHHVIARRELPRVVLGEATLAPLRPAA